MKGNLFSFLFMAVIALTACNQNSGHAGEDHTAVGVARSFIRASLNGDFKNAEKHLSNDPQGMEYMKMFESSFEKMPEAQKEQYKNASFEINNISEPNDSTTIVNFSNSYMKEPMEVKLVMQNGRWVVDFKHTANLH